MAAPLNRRSLWGEALVLMLIGLFCVFPFYWMAVSYTHLRAHET
jgi:hypothetical protein